MHLSFFVVVISTMCNSKKLLVTHLVICQYSDYVEQDIVMYINSPGGSVTAGNNSLV